MASIKDDKFIPAKVVSQHNNRYNLVSEQGDFIGKVTGKFQFNAEHLKDYPVVGDFVAIEGIEHSTEARIHHVLNRKNYFSRKVPISGGRKLKNGRIDGGLTEEQVLVSNIDTAFVLCGMDGNFNLSRIERYLTLLRHQRLDSVILLNKIDVSENVNEALINVKRISGPTPVFPISAANKTGLDLIGPYMTEGKTVVFLGSSGVGKSTLLNTLIQKNVQNTTNTSHYSGKGKHTTTHRQLFFHPTGCMIVDTPGMKELQLWAEVEDLDEVFKDVTELLANFKFSNCTHTTEPGCAIRAAIDNGLLSVERYKHYLIQFREVTHLSKKRKEYRQKKRESGS